MFVDSTRIDCDTCRRLAGATFVEAGECSTVCHQPGSQEEESFAYQALIAYPVESMVTRMKNPAIFSEAKGSFPILVKKMRTM